MNLLDVIRSRDHNGRARPVESDDWSHYYDSATPAGQRAMALGAHRRAEKLAAGNVEPDPEPQPDPKATFHSKNNVLLSKILGRPATDTNQEK